MFNNKRNKQKDALERLEAQLVSGTKTVKGSADLKTNLTKEDIVRINAEIQTLKSRI